MSFHWSIKLGIRAETVSDELNQPVPGCPSPYRRAKHVEVKADDIATEVDLDCLRAFAAAIKEAISYLEKKS
jgi:hypothetical protein